MEGSFTHGGPLSGDLEHPPRKTPPPVGSSSAARGALGSRPILRCPPPPHGFTLGCLLEALVLASSFVSRCCKNTLRLASFQSPLTATNLQLVVTF